MYISVFVLVFLLLWCCLFVCLFLFIPVNMQSLIPRVSFCLCPLLFIAIQPSNRFVFFCIFLYPFIVSSASLHDSEYFSITQYVYVFLCCFTFSFSALIFTFLLVRVRFPSTQGRTNISLHSYIFAPCH